jgi:hypothetical protein
MTNEQSARERGKRLGEVREALDLTQPEFAVLLTKTAEKLGLSVTYSGLGVSQRETGRREMDAEDYAVVSSIDPVKWPWEWLAFGRKLTRGTRVGGRVVKTGTE